MASSAQENIGISKAPIFYVGGVIFIALVFIIFPCRQYFSDGLVYAYDIETSFNWIIHPHHPLFPLGPQFVYRQLGGLDSGITGLGVISAWSTVFGIIACWGMLSILRAARLSPAAVLGGLALFAFSHGIWYFSTTPNQNSTALALHVLTLLGLMALFRRLPRASSPGNIIAVGTLASLAILSSKLNAVLVLPGLYLLLLGDASPRVKTRNIMIYIGTIITIGGGLWAILAFKMHGLGSWGEFVTWQQSYIQSAHYWANDLLDSIKRSWHGATDLHLAYLYKDGYLFGKWGEDTGSMLWFQRLPVRIAQAVVMLFFLVETVRASYMWLRARPRLPIQNIGLLAAVPIMLFSFVFTPEWINYRILYLPGFLLFLAPVLERDFRLLKPRLRRAWPLLLVIVCLFIANFTVKFLPERDPGNNIFLNEAKQLGEVFGRHDRIFFISTGGGDFRIKYTRYFTECSVSRIIDLVAEIRNNPDDVETFFRDGIEDGGTVVVHEDALYSLDSLNDVNRKYSIDIQPGEVADFFNSHFRPSGQININNEIYIIYQPVAGYAGS